MAELLAEAFFTEEKHAAILNAEKLHHSEELAKLEARTQVLDKINKGEPDPANMNMGVAKLDEKENQIKADKTVKVERCTKKLNPNAEAFKSKEPHSGEIYSLLKGMIEQQAAPDVEMETFDGNPLEYYHFMDLFREVVEKWIQDPKGRLLRLLKYTRGEAHDMIKPCLQEPSYTGYTHAQGLLRQRYGDPHIVLTSYRKEVRNWPKLTFGDAKGFRLFFNFLVKCDGVAREQNWNAINTPDVICMLVSKLPNALIDRWNRIAYNIRKKHECEPNLSDLIEFIDQETTLVNNPMFSRKAIEGFNGKSEKQPEKRNRRLKTLATEAVEEKCPICSSNHDIDECEDLKKLTVDERSKVFFKKKLLWMLQTNK